MRTNLKPADALFLQTEKPEAPQHVAMLNRYALPAGAGPDYVRALFEHLRAQPVVGPPFNQRLVAKPFARLLPAVETDPDVDLDYHVRHSALAFPGGERELAVLISRLHGSPLDLSRPLWEFHLIEGLADGQFALYMKIHHSMMDGVSGARLLARSMSTELSAIEEFVAPWAAPPPSRGARRGPATATGSRRQTGIRVVRGAVRGLRRALTTRESLRIDGLVRPWSAPQSILNRPISSQRRIAAQEFPIERLRAIGTAADATVNDVVMAICAGALRGYLAERGELPERSLVASAPVNLREAGDQGHGNDISLVLADLATDEPDPALRLARVRHSMLAAKQLLSTMTKQERTLYSTLIMAPYAIGQITALGNRHRRPMYNVMISNVPGPTDRLFLGDAELLHTSPITFLFQGQALSIVLLSYDSNITFMYTACRSSLPHVQRLVDHADASLRELELALLPAPTATTVS